MNLHQSEENNEKYYYHLLKLFKPWRSENHLSILGMTYEELYTQESHKLPDMVKYHEQTVSNYEQDQDIEKKIRERAASLPTEGAYENDEQGAFAGCVVEMTGDGFLCSNSFPFPSSQFPFPPISIPNFVTNSHSHGIPTALFSFPPSAIPIPSHFHSQTIINFNRCSITFLADKKTQA